jgi:hypothetical protein
MTKTAIGVVLLAALFAAYATKPSKEDFERHLEKNFSQAQGQKLGRGELLGWLLGKGMEVVRTGQYEPGYFSSQYHMSVAGNPIGRCTGYLGMISCSESK